MLKLILITKLFITNNMYKCYVTREDDVDLATIYVEMLDYGVFKVDKLEYDK